jgi:diguanylate cyclase (GGDEF)-like protein
MLDEHLLPHAKAIISEREQSIKQQMSRLDEFARGIMLLTIAMAVVALLLGLGCPYLASRLLVRPIADLVNTVSSFREGIKDARPALYPSNELGLLARSLKSLLDELQEADQKVRSLAFYDSTTGLPNRQFFREHLAGSLLSARLQQRSMALLLVSLTDLTRVNETLGKEAGDELIRQVARRLRDSVRLSDLVSLTDDGESVTEVSRVAGDEFTILLTKISMASDAAIAAQRIIVKITEPFEVEGREIILNVSVGIGVYPQDGADADTLLRNSGAAMSEAVKRGGNEYQFYSEAMNVTNSRKLHIHSRLNGAIDRGDFVLHYQPLREAASGHLVGAEALLRWTDSELGPVGPDEFIPIAESTGQISRIGSWVLSEACAQTCAWQDAGFREIRMSVNVSGCQLRDDDWVETVADTLRETGLSSACLDLEITETSIVREDPKTISALTRLSEMGVGIVLDDFGTGYSSLTHLRGLPINRIKIDRSFVSEITEQGEGGALAGAIVSLAHSLQLEVVAEGVETEAQAKFLRSGGCDEVQGYLFSRPVPAEEFVRFLTRDKPA